MITRLRDLLDAGNGSIKTGPFGTTLNASEYSRDGVPIVSVGEIAYGRIACRRDTPMAPPEVIDRLPEYLLSEGDVVLARKGSIDRSARVQAAQEGWFLGSDGLRIRPGTSVDSLWLAYYFLLASTRDWLLRHAAGTTMPSLSGSTLGNLPVACPSRNSQVAIAAVLGALDDKIAANTALVRTADELAAVRFAAEVADGELVELKGLCEINTRTVKPGSGSIRYIDIASLAKGTVPIPSKMDWSEAPSRARRVIRSGDIVWSTVRPNREQYFLNLADDEQLVGSTGLAILTPTSVPWTYLYEATRQKSFVDQLVAQAEGSAYPAVRADRFLNISVPLIPKDKIEALDTFAVPLRLLLQSLSEESRTLAELRDTLLPALMSGRLRVNDAERQVEDAV